MELREADIRPYEGLIGKTAQLYVGMLDLELDDLLQVLRIKVAQALVAYRDDRFMAADTAEERRRRFVFMCLTNKVKDLKRDAAARRRRGDAPCHIADQGDHERFESRYLAQADDEIYAIVDEGLFQLPSTLDALEREVAILLAFDYTQVEVAARLGVSRQRVRKALASVQEKMGDWRPEPRGREIAPPEILTHAVERRQMA